MQRDDCILVTGAKGLVGTALTSQLRKLGCTRVVELKRDNCDLRSYDSVLSAFKTYQPQFVFHSAAKVYGIGGNLKFPGLIFLENTQINTNVIEASRELNVAKIVAMGTVAVYSEHVKEPIREDDIWSGPPHSSESSYGHAKRGMLAQLEAYKANYALDYAYVLSTNLFGPNDKFDEQYGHVIPSLIKKFHHGKLTNSPISVWGDGSGVRDFMYSLDAAEALIHIMENLSGAINMGTGKKSRIADVVNHLAKHLDVEHLVTWDTSKPNGRKFCELNLSKLTETGYRPKTSLESGLVETYKWYTQNKI